MTDNKKQIEEWQVKVKKSFGEESRIYDYLFSTLDNFYYRYLETTENQDLKTLALAPNTWGAFSYESNMVEALKNKESKAFPGIKEMAKSIPKSKGPKVRYGLWVEIRELTAEKGEFTLRSEINWDFPNFTDNQKRIQKELTYSYDDLAHFRKDLALKLENVCELFL